MIEAHPALGHAAMLVAAAVNEEAAKGGAGGASASSSGLYQLSLKCGPFLYYCQTFKFDENVTKPSRKDIVPGGRSRLVLNWVELDVRFGLKICLKQLIWS